MNLTKENMKKYIRNAREAGFTDKMILVVLVKAGFGEIDVRRTLIAHPVRKVRKSKYQSKFPSYRITKQIKPISQNAFTRSWYISAITWKVMRDDKLILLFTFLGTIFNLLFAASMIVPFLLSNLIDSIFTMGSAGIVIIFLFYLVTSFIAAFFNVAIGYAIRVRTEQSIPTLAGCLLFALSKAHLILLWSAVSGSVGLIFRLIERTGRKAGPTGIFMTHFFVGLFGLSWSIATTFVIPSIIVDDAGPMKGLKNSVQTIRRSWGNKSVPLLGFGHAQSVLVFLGIIIFAFIGALSLILSNMLPTFPMQSLISIGIIIGTLYVVTIYAFFQSAKQVFFTTLYYYATKGKIDKKFGENILISAFSVENKSP